MGDRTINYNKSFAFIDQKNKVSAEITFNYVVCNPQETCC